MKILVTGSSGYLGSLLCQFLLEERHELIEYDLTTGEDILNRGMLFDKSKDSDLMIHLAGIIGMDAYDKIPERAHEINVEGTRNVVSIGKPVIFPSVTGNFVCEKGIVDEETPVAPKHGYFVSKLEAERIVDESGGIVLRYGSLYGNSPSMREDLLVHDFCKKAVSEGKLSVYQPKAKRALTSLRDAVESILFFIERNSFLKDAGLYNVVSINYPKIRIARAIANVTKCKISCVDGEDLENRDYEVSSSKIRALGFRFHPFFRENIRAIVGELHG